MNNTTKRRIKTAAFALVMLACAAIFAACSKTAGSDIAAEAIENAIEKSLNAPHYFISEYYKEDGNAAKNIAKFYQTKRVELLSDINTTTGEIYYNGDGTLVNLRARTEKQIAGNGTQADKLVWEEYAIDGKVYTRDGDNKSKKEMSTADFIQGESYKEYSMQYFLEDLKVLIKNPGYIEWGEKPYTKTGYVETVILSVKPEFNAFFKEQTGRNSYFVNSETVQIEIAYGRISNIICARIQ